MNKRESRHKSKVNMQLKLGPMLPLLKRLLKLRKLQLLLPSTWGSASNVPVTKTLAEIQREEAERAKAKQAAAKVNSPSTSFAHAIANSVPRDDGPAWTTVTSKKQASAPVVKKLPLQLLFLLQFRKQLLNYCAQFLPINKLFLL